MTDKYNFKPNRYSFDSLWEQGDLARIADTVFYEFGEDRILSHLNVYSSLSFSRPKNAVDVRDLFGEACAAGNECKARAVEIINEALEEHDLNAELVVR